MQPGIRLIVGLGNPGATYLGTRHNVGRDFVSSIGQLNKKSVLKSRQSEYSPMPVFFGLPLLEPVFVARLTCFMNQSGVPIKDFIVKENLLPSQVLVIYDDFMIPFGALRLRPDGSDGGHNGLKSTIELLGTNQIPRLRVGIGPVPGGQDPADFVLRSFEKNEEEKISDLYQVMTEAIKVILSQPLDKAMNQFNKAHF
ncbi:MAG: aminoacyl-tRNA hydrolase [Elusimicrobiota bacterium]